MKESLDKLQQLRFGYVPYAPEAKSPGDRRRFPAIAQKLGLRWELYRDDAEYDVLFVSSNGDLPYFHRLPRPGPKLCFDMVDSYMAVSTWDPKNLVRGAGKWANGSHSKLELSYRRTLEAICRRADLVVCATPEQQETMVKFCPNTHPILDFHEELGALPASSPPPGDNRFHLFWEGLGLTASQFGAVREALHVVNRDFPLVLHVVSDLKYRPINLPVPKIDTSRLVRKQLGELPFYLYEWNPTAVRALASSCHLGLIPLYLDQELFANKPENKLLIMWRLGLPVVVSATPAYTRTMAAYGGPNWACRTTEDWIDALRGAFSNTAVRERAASLGQRYAETEHGEEALRLRWTWALSSLLD